MARNVIGGLIQMSNPLNDERATVDQVRNAMFEKHLPMIEEAGKRGVQILCLQEVFNGPYFCPSQDSRWCDIAEAVPGPTVERLSAYAKKYQMAMVVPVYEREIAGVYYNTAAVIDADGTYLGKYRKNHIPQTNGFWEKFYFKPGNLGYPTFQTRYAKIGVYICYDRHFPEEAQESCPLGEVPVVADVDADLGVARLEGGIPQVAGHFPEGARLLGLHGAEIV